MRVIGLDLGSKTVGIAISDALGMLARPVKTIRFDENDYEAALDLVLNEINENKPETIVLGLPKHMNGDIGQRGEISLMFKDMLSEVVNMPVVMWDERLTTKSAEKMLISVDMRRNKRKKVIDQAAAVNILQGYLDSKRNK
ncbi:MAG: Holliday junction resolvase RuvX [Erysipelotrichaceae bacterium]|nr:Holliday junction resolvase RuvX [Erysipelotrichaceae bacterium]MDD3923754.1 Holliday junction resolvase RuvX [Erysipelotrichaceae bacterium]MDD4642324.1 Holliday junction resolvase RuvX [Erysipelotrichaceae bacterium]